MAVASLFGLGPVGDAFLFAFRVPNLARRLFGEGALSAAFLPAFSRELERQRASGQPTAWQLANAVFAAMSVLLAALAVLGELVLWAIAWSAPADERLQLIVGLLAVMLPYAVLICLAAQLTAVLHALEHFTWPAFVPVALNVVQIAGAWWIAPAVTSDRAEQAYVLAVCVLVAGVVQLGVQVPPLLKYGYGPHWNWSQAWSGLRDVGVAVLPVTLGLSITQINTVFDSVIATVFAGPPGSVMPLPGSPAYPLATGAVSALYFGERMYQFPLGVFGIALSTVLFPRMSQHVARGEPQLLRDDLSLGLRLILAIGLPASAGLILVAEPITRLLFQQGEFGETDVARTAAMIAAYAAGVWAYCGIPVLYRGFYALGDRATPVKIGLLAVAFDLTLNLSLIWPLAERGLAVSTALSAVIQLIVLTWALQFRVGRLHWGEIVPAGVRALACTAAMTAVCWLAMRWLPDDSSKRTALIQVLALLGLGAGAYFAAAVGVGLREVSLIVRPRS